MIHVEPQPEPADFDEHVRRPGAAALASLVEKFGDLREVPSKDLPPYWRRCLPQLYSRYAGVCAYVAVLIEQVTGARTTDHFIPRSGDPRLAYEWANYRLACSLMNSRKSAAADVLDPFEVEDGWFELSLPSFGVQPASWLPDDTRERVQSTIDRLGLDEWDCRTLRHKHFLAYQAGHIDLHWFEHESPFVARELRRQGLLLETDQ